VELTFTLLLSVLPHYRSFIIGVSAVQERPFRAASRVHSQGGL
jgi:hypothetical protein